MKRIIITIILVHVLTTLFGQNSGRISKENVSKTDSLHRNRKLSRSERDQAIRNNLIGSWHFHSGIWQFQEDGKYQFFYRDTVRTSGTWKVKNGLIKTFKKWPRQNQWLREERVVYSSSDTIKFKTIGSIDPDKVITMYKVK